MRQKFAAAFDGNARFKKSAVKKTRKILALLFKTIYNKSRQSDPLRHAGDVVFEQFFLYASIYRRGKRHARRARKGIKIPVLPDGNNRLAGVCRRARRDFCQGSRGGYARHALRRQRRGSVHTAIRARLSRVCVALYALSFRPRGNPQGDRDQRRFARRGRKFFRRAFRRISYVFSRVAPRRAHGVCLSVCGCRIAENLFLKGTRLRRLRKMPWWRSLPKNKYSS